MSELEEERGRGGRRMRLEKGRGLATAAPVLVVGGWSGWCTLQGSL